MSLHIIGHFSKYLTLTLFAILVCLAAPQVSADNAWPELKGPYLGQKPPGNTPVLFAPDLVSTKDGFELNAVFSPDQKIFMFSRQVDGVYKMFFSSRNPQGMWREPQLAGPSKTYPGHRDVDMAFSANQQWLYFISDRPLQGYSLDRYNIWRSKITKHGLQAPMALGAHINGPGHELYPMIVADGSLYFSAQRPDTLGQRDSYRSQFRDGAFEDPVNLGPAINSPYWEGDIYVSPDESILISASAGREDDLGNGDLYISFKQADGTWSPSQHMGPVFNSAETDYCPMISPDGKYFFFSRAGDVYWVSSDALLAFKN